MPKLTDYNYCMLNTAALYAKKKFPNKNLSSKGKKWLCWITLYNAKYRKRCVLGFLNIPFFPINSWSHSPRNNSKAYGEELPSIRSGYSRGPRRSSPPMERAKCNGGSPMRGEARGKWQRPVKSLWDCELSNICSELFGDYVLRHELRHQKNV